MCVCELLVCGSGSCLLTLRLLVTQFLVFRAFHMPTFCFSRGCQSHAPTFGPVPEAIQASSDEGHERLVVQWMEKNGEGRRVRGPVEEWLGEREGDGDLG